MKKFLIILVVIFICVCVSSCVMSNENLPDNSEILINPIVNDDQFQTSSDDQVSDIKVYKITFKQTGYDDIVKTVNGGESLTDIPNPVSKNGYVVCWDRNDFSDINENIVISAIETPKTFTVILIANGGVIILNDESVYQTTITVTYDAEYTLPVPEHIDCAFENWQYGQIDVSINGV